MNGTVRAMLRRIAAGANTLHQAHARVVAVVDTFFPGKHLDAVQAIVRLGQRAEMAEQDNAKLRMSNAALAGENRAHARVVDAYSNDTKMLGTVLVDAMRELHKAKRRPRPTVATKRRAARKPRR